MQYVIEIPTLHVPLTALTVMPHFLATKFVRDAAMLILRRHHRLIL